jgi:hypothetical protein
MTYKPQSLNFKESLFDELKSWSKVSVYGHIKNDFHFSLSDDRKNEFFALVGSSEQPNLVEVVAYETSNGFHKVAKPFFLVLSGNGHDQDLDIFEFQKMIKVWEIKRGTISLRLDKTIGGVESLISKDGSDFLRGNCSVHMSCPYEAKLRSSTRIEANGSYWAKNDSNEEKNYIAKLTINCQGDYSDKEDKFRLKPNETKNGYFSTTLNKTFYDKSDKVTANAYIVVREDPGWNESSDKTSCDFPVKE